MENEFIEACRIGDIEKIQELLEQGVEPSIDDNLGFRWACERGHTDIVKLLLSLDEPRGVDPSACDNIGFQWACERNNIEIIKLLLSLDESRGVDPSADDNYGFRRACYYGRVDVVKLLLSLDESKGIDPSANDNYGFFWACYRGHTEVVEFLLSLDESKGINPSINDFMNLDFFDDDKELFLSFIHHPRFYPSDSGILPERVQKRVEELEQKFFGTEKGIRAKPFRKLKI